MIARHQGAVQLAEAPLKYGKRPEWRKAKPAAVRRRMASASMRMPVVDVRVVGMRVRERRMAVRVRMW